MATESGRGHPHLQLAREEPVTERRTRRGFSSAAQPDDPQRHATLLGERLQAARDAAAAADVGGYDERSLIKITLADKVPVEDVARATGNVDVVSQEAGTLLLAFGSESQLDTFKARLARLASGEHVSYSNVLYALQDLDRRTPEDRTGWALRRDGMPDHEPLILDAEVLPLERTDEAHELRGAFECWVTERDGAILDSVKQPHLTTYRIRCTQALAEGLLRHRDVRTVDLPPRIGLERALLSSDIHEIEAPPPPPDGAPGIAVLDSGVVTGHPLLSSAVGDAQSFLPDAPAAGVELLSGSRQLLLAAACSTVRPQRRFRAGRNDRASTYVAGVRLGHTEPGSFIVNLRVPVSPSLAAPEPAHLFAPPFERRANRTLVAGLRAAREATDLVNRGEHVRAFDERVPDGVSANLCTAAAELIDVGGGLEVSVSWALTRPVNEEHDARRAIVAFEPPDAPVLREAAQILSDRQERVDERIQGYVSKLARDQSEPEGRATIKVVIDGALTSVKADFSPSEYGTIAQAHANRWSVSLEGDLRREGQLWHLSNPRGLRLAGETPMNTGRKRVARVEVRRRLASTVTPSVSGRSPAAPSERSCRV